ncbi:ROK family transcriptional regulator [Cohnella thailandensis]|uniref:ROK family transcriptional regulator n=1 Tax=Cohnella thailandensis TaxID=557557 RepID=A0A841SV18_9BACL|nr:ROK family transcriptional regulator [Cohnella thailandensis]MBB6633905.1 ROK family transcriptional regulator [Cohnella thailandensis]MBP1972588.1 putative NBD/HSP70 family sugar kinase [Cohnella thailandensis]
MSESKHTVKQDQEVIKQHNKQLVLDVIRTRRPISRSEISKITEMSATSVGRIVSELTDEGLVRETSLTSSGVGRKAVMLDIEPSGRYAIGIDIQKKRIVIGLMDFAERLITSKELKHTSQEAQAEETIALMASSVTALLEEQGISSAKVAGIGIGTPGVIDYERGVVQFSSTLGWRDFPLAMRIQEKTGLRTVIDNDLKVKILGEYLFGAAQGSDKTVLINVGTGIGSSLIINGDIFRGGSNSAGELGHMTIHPHGNLCECGKRGCLQTYIDESALLGEARKVSAIREIGELFAAVRRNEEWAVEIIDRAAFHIAVTINNIVCLYNPDTVILSGDLVEGFGEILEWLDRHCEQVVWEPFRDSFQVIASRLHGRSIVLGAGALALQQATHN